MSIEYDESMQMTMPEANAIECEMSGHLDAAFAVLHGDQNGFRMGDLTQADLCHIAATLANGMATLHAAQLIAKALKQGTISRAAETPVDGAGE